MGVLAGQQGFAGGLHGSLRLHQIAVAVLYQLLRAGEGKHEAPSPLVADVGHSGEDADGVLLGAQSLVPAGGKAVGLVPDTLEEPQCVAALGQADGLAVAGAVDFLVSLCQSRHGNVQLEGGKHGLDGVYLADASVYQNQVRQVGLLVQKPGVAAGHCLTHGGKVVDDAVGGLQAEVAVVLLVRVAVVKADEAGHGKPPADVGNVKALDADGQMGQVQVMLQLLHGRHVSPFPQAADDVLPCVLEGHVHGCQVALVVRLGSGICVLGHYLDVRVGVQGGGKPLPGQVKARGGGDKDFRGDYGSLGVVGRKEFAQQLLGLIETDGAVVVPA